MTIHDHIPDALRHAVDALSIGVVLGTLFDRLPGIAALFTIVWTTIRIANEIEIWRARRRLRKGHQG